MITQKRIQIGVIVLGLIIMNIFFVSAIAGSIGNARMILYPEVNGWTTTTIEKTILVKNTNDVPVNISLKSDENSSKFIEIIDKEFVLEPNTERKARFEVRVKKEGTYEGKINVFFTSAEGKEAGVVLPSTIIIVAKKDQGDNGGNTIDKNTDESDNSAPIDGNVVKDSKISPVVIISFISTLILLVVLVFLVYFLKSKKKKPEENKIIDKKKIKKGEKKDGKEI